MPKTATPVAWPQIVLTREHVTGRARACWGPAQALAWERTVETKTVECDELSKRLEALEQEKAQLTKELASLGVDPERAVANAAEAAVSALQKAAAETAEAKGLTQANAAPSAAMPVAPQVVMAVPGATAATA